MYKFSSATETHPDMLKCRTRWFTSNLSLNEIATEKHSGQYFSAYSLLPDIVRHIYSILLHLCNNIHFWKSCFSFCSSYIHTSIFCVCLFISRVSVYAVPKTVNGEKDETFSLGAHCQRPGLCLQEPKEGHHHPQLASPFLLWLWRLWHC